MSLARSQTYPPTIFVAHPFTADGRAIVRTVIAPALRSRHLEISTFHAAPAGNLVIELSEAINRCAGVLGLSIGSSPNILIEMGIAIGLKKRCIMIADAEERFGMLHGNLPTLLLSEYAATTARLTSLIDTMFCASAPNVFADAVN